MNRLMIIARGNVVISFGPELNQFRGEFTGHDGGADCYARKPVLPNTHTC
ncbi:MAG: hypothetical protein ABIP49_09270 [Lysobacterales bacterium]